MATTEIHTLPPVPANFSGETHEQHHKYTIKISNQQGYLCRVSVTAIFDAPPDVIFALFTHPDNSSFFRDVKRVANRDVVEERPGYKLVRVEQVGEMKIMWMRKTFSTFLEVEEDCRNPELLTTTFSLVKSDVLGRFHGTWKLVPVKDPITGVVTTQSELEQDVLPKGVPPFMRRLPVLGGLLRDATKGVIKRLLEDIFAFVDKVNSGIPLSKLLGDDTKEKDTTTANFTSFPLEAEVESLESSSDQHQVPALNDVTDSTTTTGSAVYEQLVHVQLAVLTDGTVELSTSPHPAVQLALHVTDDNYVQTVVN